MPVKTYGIYLAYSPNVDLRTEGLGRHLAEFLKGAQARDDIHFVLACPSWMRANLLQLFEACNISCDSFEIISPDSTPLLLGAYQKYIAIRSRVRSARPPGGLRYRLRQLGAQLKASIERKLVSTRSIVLVVLLGGLLSLFFLSGASVRKMASFFSESGKLRKKAGAVLARIPVVGKREVQPDTAVESSQESRIARMYRLMEESEAALMRDMIEARKDIAAWYCPTAFWPHFNDISAPRLMCVPDVVLTEFPTGFALIAGNPLLENFRRVEKAIRGGEHFVTYSNQIKWRTLVERYGADPDTVFVVPHGANRLDDLIFVSGFADNDAATDMLCRRLFRGALHKASSNTDQHAVLCDEVNFIFYASQFRPNKNVISLLRAYEHLLRRRFIGHKLILTGRPLEKSDVQRFIEDRNLQNDVLFLHGLSEQELAACYRLADLAVNPSLSEGGCPFTFTEALSVGTPAVMARIPVTEEVISDPDLQEWMLFDPYDWMDMADKIEWSLRNLDLLLARQKPYYERLAQRSWHNVVDEYVSALDRISSQREAASCAHARAC
jgi:glycosyltransferase involved in cell wall biosynthesis